MIHSATTSVGIVGTGEMGMPLVQRLLQAGFPVAAYARRNDSRDLLARMGASLVDNLGELGARRDVVFVYVYSDEQVRAVTLEGGLLDAMAPGSTLVIVTTGSPLTARLVGERANSRGVRVVDAPGSGGPAQVANGTLSVFVGGDDADVDRCRPLFDAYASHVYHLGALGTGQYIKLINNLLFGCHIELAAEACRIAALAGIDDATLARTLSTCSGQSYSLDLIGTIGSVERLVEAAGHFVYKDVAVARDVAAETDAPLGSFGPLIDPLLRRTAPKS